MPRLASPLALATLLCICSPSSAISPPHWRRGRPTTAPASTGNPSPAAYAEWKLLLQRVYALVQAGQLDDVAPLASRARQLAREHPEHRAFVAKTLEFEGFHAAHQQRYPDAVRAYLGCKRVAVEAGERMTAALAANALSNLYSHSENFVLAAESARQALELLPASAPQQIQLATRLQSARTTARMGNLNEAVSQFVAVIEQAQAAGDQRFHADAWQMLGKAYRNAGHTDAAERAAVEAFRLRKLFHDPEIQVAYQDLALIYLERGNPAFALKLLDAADQAPTSRRLGRWLLEYSRGRALLASGRPVEALAPLKRALDRLHKTHAYLLPGDQLLVNSQAMIASVYSLFVNAAVRAALAGAGHADLVAEAFAVAEASRAVGLRIRAESRARMAPEQATEHARLVARMQSAYEQALSAPASGEATQTFRRIRLELSELDAQSGVPGVGSGMEPPWQPANLAMLRPDEALVSFSLSSQGCWRFAATRRSLAVHPLPELNAIRAAVAQYRAALEKDAPEAPDLGTRLYSMLFGGLPTQVSRLPLWMITADDVLFQVPFSALRLPESGRYVIERHALLSLPGIWMLSHRRVPDRTQPASFLGVGDPIYNNADPRREASDPPVLSPLELPRLPGSANELEVCSRPWPLRRLLTGAHANATSVASALAAVPHRVIHFATHVIRSPQTPSESLIALSPASGGSGPSLVGPEWIAAQQAQARLVVLNGCQSGSGDINAAEGLMGLSRAWLYAGAGAVISTYWPTLDDAGYLLQRFYYYLQTRSHARALQAAQIEMIGQGDWRARARYWATYFLVEHPE